MSALCDENALDVLCPMHLILDAAGGIVHAGPTLKKMLGHRRLIGTQFFDLFQVKRPRAIDTLEDLRGVCGVKLRLALVHTPETTLKGIVVAATAVPDRLILNLSFGISLIDAVRDYQLNNADFAATDLAIEMLYLVEAKTAAMEASRHLNLRLQGAKITAEEQAFTDTLTGLKNRRALERVLSRLIEGRRPFAVMQIDLDFFKAVNDTMGHAAGDHVLQTVAQIMIEETRSADTVARMGGDEFAVVLPDVRSEKILRQVGRRVIDRIEKPIAFQDDLCRISASIGTVWIQSDQRPSIEQLLSDADVALYASKHAGRARHTLYTSDLRRVANKTVPPLTKQRNS
ncbi:MAG: GGDEF domain-containing protein [Pseudomonadota bacterium]